MKRLLLDENLPRQLARQFSSGFEVTSVPDLGWQSKTNGELLSAMQDAGLEYLITADRNLRHQQNLDKYKIQVVILDTFDTRLKYLDGSVNVIEAAILESDSAAKVIDVDLRSRPLT
jgi:predicted nuclease of predicted toxin-antitoxin system